MEFSVGDVVRVLTGNSQRPFGQVGRIVFADGPTPWYDHHDYFVEFDEYPSSWIQGFYLELELLETLAVSEDDCDNGYILWKLNEGMDRP